MVARTLKQAFVGIKWEVVAMNPNGIKALKAQQEQA
jgi:hypothetical protein